MNLACLLTETVARHPDRPVVRLGSSTWTYRQLDEAVATFAGTLRAHGIGPDDRVGLMLPNVPQFAVVYYAVLRLGAVVVPMNVMLKERETAYHLGDSGAAMVVAWHEVAAAAQAGAAVSGARCLVVAEDLADAPASAGPVRHDVERSGSETAVILYTSGTTGTPKGAELTHDNIHSNVSISTASVFELRETDVVLGALPLFHVFGQDCAMNSAVHAGGLLTLVPRFDATHVLEVIQRDRVTVFQGVPTMINALLHHPRLADYDLTSLRLCCSAGASIPAEVLTRFEAAVGCQVLEGYGLSEASGIASWEHPGQPREPGSVGTPIAGVDMAVVADDGRPVPDGQVGEILVRGHNVMKGYWGRPEATAETVRDGWLSTGDLGRRDEHGRYFVVDRKKDMIIRGGYNVYPREVEEVLHESPLVREAAVIGFPDAYLGEEVAAAVVAKDGADLDVDDLRAYVKGQVAAYKYPRLLWLVDELPKGPSGKILKREIRVPEHLAHGGGR